MSRLLILFLFLYYLPIFGQDIIPRDSISKLLYKDPRLAKTVGLENYYLKIQRSDTADLAQYENLLGIIYRRNGLLDSALYFHEKSIQRFQKEGNPMGIAHNLSNLSTVFEIKNDTTNSRQKLRQSLQFYTQENAFDGILFCNLNLGNSFYRTNNYNKALGYYLKAYNNLDKVDNPRYRLVTITNLAVNYSKLGNFEQAKKFNAIAEELSLAYQDNTNLPVIIQNKGFIAEYEGNLIAAEAFYKEAVERFYTINDSRSLDELYRVLIDFYKNQNNWKEAQKSTELLLHFRDSIKGIEQSFLNEKLLKNIEDINTINQLKIATLKADTALAESEKKSRIILFVGGLLILGVFFGLYLLKNLREIKKLNLKIVEQREELKKQRDAVDVLNKDLEQLIKERTLKLTLTNEKLKEYAFFNAHKLRTPVANILGLHLLLEQSDSLEEKEKIFCLLAKSIEQFDELVNEVQHIVRDQN